MGFRVNSAGKVNQGHFAKVPAMVGAPRSAFDRSFSHKTAVAEGDIIPLVWEPILPGDTVNLTTQVLARLSTPVFPYMDNVYADLHWFFVANRTIWDNWEKFQGARTNPDDSVDFEVPQLDDGTHAAGFGQNTIYDYLGLPTKIAGIPQADMPISLPFRALCKIWNEWYRDENYQDSLAFPTGDGPDTFAYGVYKRNRRKDYFTSALPWPQKGADVQLSLGTSAPIYGIDQTTMLYPANNPTSLGPLYADDGATPNLRIGAPSTHTPASEARFSTDSAEIGLEADLSAAVGPTINALREAIVLQQMLELDARGGTRYVEVLLARFGVVSPDFRLQRAEYLGGQTFDINVNPIAQTSETTTSPQGNLAAFASGRGRSALTHSFVEHGQLFGLLSFRADTTYQQGLNRHWSVRTRYDYYEPMAANLGEQALLGKELYMDATSADNDVIGYQERWAEYRFKPSYVTGAFRSNYTGTLDSWHLALDFDTRPTIEDILPEAPPIERIVAVADEPHFIVDSFTRFRHVRVMPIYSVPGLTRL